MAKQRQRLIEVPFSKTECGVDFFINTAHGRERPGVLTEYEAFKTDFFEIFQESKWLRADRLQKDKTERWYGALREAPPAAGVAHR